MEFKISSDTLKKTDKFQTNLSCLTGGKECLCAVEEHINNRIIFIKSPSNCPCNYRMSFGYSYTCNCPVRREIYKAYKV